MKLKKFTISLSIFFIVCFGSLSKIFILKAILLILISNIYSSIRFKKYIETIESLKSELTLSRSIIVSDFKSIIDIDNSGLTESEYEILEYICKFSPTNSELCKRFGKSLSTVKNQIKAIMDKLGVDSRYDLIMSCRNNFQ